MDKIAWHPTLGNGVSRLTRDGALITIRPAWNGGIRIVVARPDGGIYFPTHSRQWML
jgi:hypothetical protein